MLDIVIEADAIDDETLAIFWTWLSNHGVLA